MTSQSSVQSFDEESATATVNARWADTPDGRLKTILSSLVSHLHDFVREVELTSDEWQKGIEFLTATGKKCDDVRQEFILLSDVLGVSMLVEAINNRRPAAATESTVLGPFHVVDSPTRELGDDISQDATGEPCVVTGHVVSLDGTPLPGSIVDVWQANGDGLYDVQDREGLPEGNLRGLFTTDETGRFWFRSVVPRYYPIPLDGPVGVLLRATRRHPNRPAHIHFIAGAHEHQPLTTHMFLEDSLYLDSDPVFAVKRELVRPVTQEYDKGRAEMFGVEAPFRQIEFNIVLNPVKSHVN